MAKNIGNILLSNGLPKRKARINLGGTHITSMDFGKYKILHSSLLMPGDKISSNVAHNVRLSGMIAPTIGKCDLTIKSFFVPCRVAWEGFEPFINKLPWYTASGAITPNMPKVNNSTLHYLFATFCGFRANGKVEARSAGSVYEEDFDTPKFVCPSGHKRVINAVNSRYLNNPLTEIIGVCDGVNTDGTPLNPKYINKLIETATGSGEYYPEFTNQLGSALEYDFISAIGGLKRGATASNLSGDYVDWVDYAWQHTPTKEIIDSVIPSSFTSTHLGGSYVMFRFTAIGKAIYDQLLTLGYTINFCHPARKTTPTTQSPININFDTNSKKCTHWTMNSNVSITPSINCTKWTDAELPLHLSATSDQYDCVGYRCLVPQNTSPNSACDHTYFNMLPLFSYWRVFLDHLCPMQFYNTWASYYENYLHLNGFNANIYVLSKLYDSIITSYDKDYFTTAWQSPNSPNNDNTQNINYQADATQLIPDNTSHAPYYTNKDEEGLDLSTSSLSSLGLRLLNALTKYRRINNVSGQRAVDRILARFGTRPSDERVNRAELVGGCHSQFDISLVMSQAQTDGANLGDYTAHGESRNSGKIGHYTASEWGYFLVVAWITPSARYVQGRTRQNMYIDVEDFLTPELDEIDAMQAIRQDELYADCRCFNDIQTGSTTNTYKPNGTFGYTRMWGEMKVGRDILSGDFRLDSRGKYSNSSFHLFRMLPTIGERAYRNMPLVNNNDFNICSDAIQYDRIFQYDGDDYDHFFCYFKIDVDCTRNTKSITDFTLNDENDDTRLTSTEMFGHQVK